MSCFSLVYAASCNIAVYVSPSCCWPLYGRQHLPEYVAECTHLYTAASIIPLLYVLFQGIYIPFSHCGIVAKNLVPSSYYYEKHPRVFVHKIHLTSSRKITARSGCLFLTKYQKEENSLDWICCL